MDMMNLLQMPYSYKCVVRCKSLQRAIQILDSYNLSVSMYIITQDQCSRGNLSCNSELN